jgi:hypothetical protein
MRYVERAKAVRYEQYSSPWYAVVTGECDPV